jgi:spore coat protein U-like protein
MERAMRGQAALVVFLVCAASPAWAASASSQFNVTATVLKNCAVSSSDLAFGDYTAGSGSPVTASTTVSVTCTAALAYTIALDGGQTTSDVTARAMTDGASHNLSYGLYTTNAYGTVWGDGTGGSSTVAGTGNGAAQAVTVYGRIAAAQFVAAGSYTDRVTVTVNY